MPAESNVKILVADDNSIVLTLVCEWFMDLAYKVQAASNGLEALRHFKRENFDLVLTDIQMPCLNGWELTCQVKSLVPGTPVIAMTGMHPEEVPDQLGDYAPDRILFKPLEIRQLEEAVHTALESCYLKIA